jgi:3-dehydroquinate dehydratase type I
VTPKICVSILPKSIPETLQLIEKAEKSNADLIEIRLDHLENLGEMANLATHGKTPKIATDKSSRPETEQRKMLLSAAKSGFEYVDVDLSTENLENLVMELKAQGAKLVLSFHKVAGSFSPSELKNVLERQISSGADVCKIVTTAKRIEDNLTILNFTSEASARTKLVCFCMGELGKISRLLSPLFGGFFTFASLEKGGETASGQMTIQEMKTAYKLLG